MIGTERHDTELARLCQRYLHTADRDVGTAFFVEGHQRAVVHLIDVVASQNQHRFGAVLIDDVEILVNGVRGAAIPDFAELLLRRHDIDELAELAVQVAPAALHMLNKGVGLILRENEDLADPGIHAVGQREIDDAVLTAERRSRFRSIVRELHEPLPAPTCHHDRHRAASELTNQPATGYLSHWDTSYYFRTPCV